MGSRVYEPGAANHRILGICLEMVGCTPGPHSQSCPCLAPGLPPPATSSAW
jgi:hypothetical protein